MAKRCLVKHIEKFKKRPMGLSSMSRKCSLAWKRIVDGVDAGLEVEAGAAFV